MKLTNRIGTLILLVSLCSYLSLPLSYGKSNVTDSCQGRFFNPISDLNWDLIFPIRIAGVKIDPGLHSNDSSRTQESSLCVCPSPVLGIPTPGILVTFHEPLYLEEIVKTPGCFSSLGGIKLFSGYESEQTHLKMDTNSSSRWQVHWYEYPLFSLLDLFKGFSCINRSGFSLAYMTEFDPTWQDDAWGAISAPEAIIFSTVEAQSSCAIDAISGPQGHPIDNFFWCAGSWGSVYPLTGNTNAVADHIQSANLQGAKLIARLARMGLLWRTVGSDAVCSSVPMNIWVKSQFNLDPVYPTISNSNGLPIGASTAIWQYSPPQAYPYYENIHQIILQEQQCCIRL